MKFAMSGHVDNAYRLAVGEANPGEAQINCHLAAKLFRKPIGIDPAQFFHQCRLAVVDVARGTDDPHLLSAADRAAVQEVFAALNAARLIAQRSVVIFVQ